MAIKDLDSSSNSNNSISNLIRMLKAISCKLRDPLLFNKLTQMITGNNSNTSNLKRMHSNSSLQ